MSQAVQLGSARGTVVFGQTLDLTVPVRLDAQNDDAATCFTADIYQADTRFDAGRVRLEVSPIGKNLDANVRIRSITKINEPWAKLVLSSNCGTRISKSYEFLTEFSSELPANEATQAINKSIALSVTAVPATPALISPSNKPVLPAAIKKAIANRKSLKPKTITPKTTTAQNLQRMSTRLESSNKPSPKDTSESGKSRLRMETFELSDEHKVLLKLSNALTTPNSDTRTPEEAQALAQAKAVWRAINGMPATDEATLAQAAENVKKLKEVETKAANSAKLADQKLAEATDFYKLIVYGLLGLLALALAGIVWSLLKMRKTAKAQEYSWLNEVDEHTKNVTATHENTQFLPTAMGDDVANDSALADPVLDHKPSKAQPNSDLVENPLASLLSNSKVVKKKIHGSQDIGPMGLNYQAINHDNMSSQVLPKPLELDEKPRQLTEERFDERVLKARKKNRNINDRKPMSSDVPDIQATTNPPVQPVAETIDFDMTDISAGKPASAAIPIAKNSSSNKSDAKSNLIDFDIFAEPPPTTDKS